jgi:hypothetical protein
MIAIAVAKISGATQNQIPKKAQKMMISTHNPHLHTSIPPTNDPTMLMSRVLNQPIRLSKPSSNHPSTAQMNNLKQTREEATLSAFTPTGL